jgi:hypothetical protein
MQEPKAYCTNPDHQPGEHDQACTPPADPHDAALRLIRAVFGLCAVCDRSDDHDHEEEEYEHMINPEYAHANTAIEAVVEHLIYMGSGWREVEWNDERTVVTLLNGEDFITISVTSDEVRDAISERSHGAFEEREFNDND